MIKSLILLSAILFSFNSFAGPKAGLAKIEERMNELRDLVIEDSISDQGVKDSAKVLYRLIMANRTKFPKVNGISFDHVMTFALNRYQSYKKIKKLDDRSMIIFYLNSVQGQYSSMRLALRDKPKLKEQLEKMHSFVSKTFIAYWDEEITLEEVRKATVKMAQDDQTFLRKFNLLYHLKLNIYFSHYSHLDNLLIRLWSKDLDRSQKIFNLNSALSSVRSLKNMVKD